jgi:hypothetical protein
VTIKSGVFVKSSAVEIEPFDCRSGQAKVEIEPFDYRSGQAKVEIEPFDYRSGQAKVEIICCCGCSH